MTGDAVAEAAAGSSVRGPMYGDEGTELLAEPGAELWVEMLGARDDDADGDANPAPPAKAAAADEKSPPGDGAVRLPRGVRDTPREVLACFAGIMYLSSGTCLCWGQRKDLIFASSTIFQLILRSRQRDLREALSSWLQMATPSMTISMGNEEPG